VFRTISLQSWHVNTVYSVARWFPWTQSEVTLALHLCCVESFKAEVSTLPIWIQTSKTEIIFNLVMPTLSHQVDLLVMKS
jgi:hypothetical protein